MEITTLIPAFKPKFLPDLILALRNQTIKPCRVIISDDHPDQAFHAILANADCGDINLEIIPGPRKGSRQNMRHLLKTWGGNTALVHILFDDDFIYPTFYETHLAAHASGQCDCSVSKRWTAIESGLPIGKLPAPAEIEGHNNRLLLFSDEMLFPNIVPFHNNWLGEFSNAVFNREIAPLLDNTRLADISYVGLEDIGFFLAASLKKPLGYINDWLGFFRINAGQNTQQTQSPGIKCGYLAWAALALAGERLGKLRPEEVDGCLMSIWRIIQERYCQADDMRVFLALCPQLLERRNDALIASDFLAHWHGFTSRDL